MSFESTRLSVMDAQRYDLSKRRMPSTLSINTKATSGHAEYLSELPTDLSPTLSHMLDNTTPWTDHTIALMSRETDDASPSVTEDSSSDTLDNSSTGHGTPASTLASSTSITLDRPNAKVVYQTDVFDRGDFTTTRTIIRPVPRSPILGLFSRPSSPIFGMFSRPSSPAIPYSSRPSSPLCFNLSTLNCLGSTDAFNEEMAYPHGSREKEIAAAQNGLDVRVEQERYVQREELWREGVQAMLYGEHNMAARLGRVEVVY